MMWDKSKRWDEVTYKDEITAALLDFISTGEKRQALITSYGDLGVLMRNLNRNRGGTAGEFLITGMSQGVEVSRFDSKFKCQITWNKAAKLVSAAVKKISGSV